MDDQKHEPLFLNWGVVKEQVALMLVVGVVAVVVVAVGKWETRRETQSFPLIHQPMSEETIWNISFGMSLKTMFRKHLLSVKL